MSLTSQLQLIQNDIIRLLKKGVSLDQFELFEQTELKNISEFGWSFALEKLEKAGKIKCDNDGKYHFIKE